MFDLKFFMFDLIFFMFDFIFFMFDLFQCFLCLLRTVSNDCLTNCDEPLYLYGSNLRRYFHSTRI